MANIMSSPVIIIIFSLFIILYGLNLAKIKLPNYIKKLFDNTIFKIVFLSLLLAYNFKAAPHVAVIVALTFVLTLDYMNQQEMRENLSYLEYFVKN
jgi:Cu/Ag efflux pump CusA